MGKVVAIVVGEGVSVAVGTEVSVDRGGVGEGAAVGAWAVGLAQALTARIMMTANNNWIFLCIATPESCAQFYHRLLNQVK